MKARQARSDSAAAHIRAATGSNAYPWPAEINPLKAKRQQAKAEAQGPRREIGGTHHAI